MYQDLNINNQWIELIATLGIDTTNTSVRVQNKSGNNVLYTIDNVTYPESGFSLDSLDSFIIPKGAETCYVRLEASTSCTGTLSFQDVEDFTKSGELLSDLLTSEKVNIRRLSVDAQPTSYEANEQFKIFHRMINIPTTTQPAFRFTAADPVNIMERKINIWSGGREYLVIPDDGSHPTQEALFDALVDTVAITNVNGNLHDSGLTSHPVSGVEIKYLELTGGNIFTIADTDQYPNGDAVQTDGNTNRANNQLLSSPNKSGVAAGQGFFLVFRNIAQSAATNGHFYLQWEERFNN